MKIASFRDMYLAELQELRSVQTQLIEEWRRAADVASRRELKDALLRCFEETQLQQERLDRILQSHNADPRAHTDQAMQAIVLETEKMMSILLGNELRDAGLIASAQKVLHYQIAAYGTAAALAGQLGFRDDQQVLHACDEEVKRADHALTDLAKRIVNPDAVATA
jgi:ferritin-like metal-binding protein YciE